MNHPLKVLLIENDFIDYEKGYDRVQHNNKLQTLQNIPLDNNEIRWLFSLYWSQSSMVILDGDEPIYLVSYTF